MGSQVEFFLGPSDLIALSDAFSQLAELVYLRPDLRVMQLHAPEDIVPRYGTENLRFYIARKHDVQLLMSHREGEIESQLPHHTTYQPIVEFDRPFVSNSYIRAGRMYRVDSYYLPSGEVVRKSEDWISWAKKLFAVTRKSLAKVGDSGYYAGEEALAMRSSGILFQQIDDPRNQLCT
jgi:hypothetical protein